MRPRVSGAGAAGSRRHSENSASRGAKFEIAQQKDSASGPTPQPGYSSSSATPQESATPQKAAPRRSHSLSAGNGGRELSRSRSVDAHLALPSGGGYALKGARSLPARGERSPQERPGPAASPAGGGVHEEVQLALGDVPHPAHAAVRALTPRPALAGLWVFFESALIVRLLVSPWEQFTAIDLIHSFYLLTLALGLLHASEQVHRHWRPAEPARKLGSNAGSSIENAPQPLSGSAKGEASPAVTTSDSTLKNKYRREAHILLEARYPHLLIERGWIATMLPIAGAIFYTLQLAQLELTQWDTQFEDVADVASAENQAIVARYLWTKAQYLSTLAGGTVVISLHLALMIVRLGAKIQQVHEYVAISVFVIVAAVASALWAPSPLDAVGEMARQTAAALVCLATLRYGRSMFRFILQDIERSSGLTLVTTSELHDRQLEAMQLFLLRKDNQALARARLQRSSRSISRHGRPAFRSTLEPVHEENEDDAEEQGDQVAAELGLGDGVPPGPLPASHKGAAPAVIGSVRDSSDGETHHGARASDAATRSGAMQPAKKSRPLPRLLIDHSCWRCITTVSGTAAPSARMVFLTATTSLAAIFIPFVQRQRLENVDARLPLFLAVIGALCVAFSAFAVAQVRGRSALRMDVVGAVAMAGVLLHQIATAAAVAATPRDGPLRSMRCAISHGALGSELNLSVTGGMLFLARVLLACAPTMRGSFRQARLLMLYVSVIGGTYMGLNIFQFQVIPMCEGAELRLYSANGHWMIPAFLFYVSLVLFARLRERGILAGARAAMLCRALEKKLRHANRK